MVKRLATSPHDPLGITDSACKNQLVVVSVQYGPFNPYIPIRSTTIGKSRVAIDPTSWRSNSDIASVTSIGYSRMSASGESSTTMHRLLHAPGSHPIPTPYDPNNSDYTHPNPTLNSRPPPLSQNPPPPLIDRSCSDQFFEENPSVLISSGLLVQADEGVSLPVVDLIDESTAAYLEEPMIEKPIYEQSTDDKKKAILDNVAKDILYKIVDKKNCSANQDVLPNQGDLEKADSTVRAGRSRQGVQQQKADMKVMKVGESMAKVCERFSSVVIELTALGKKHNKELTLKVMRALLEEWDVKTMAMWVSKDLNNLKLHNLFVDMKPYKCERGDQIRS
ncbi:hypothetical protein F511_03508 [Dorcoceras hygrometricum]|uniref:Uncharacterized protein n=1 Tax=Dorcoceras hygrometricum TaxID=472368 RepID=A0A2Z7AQJ0_9LAMI|nr:hypothetical protein F511_03508 [Dorcoceras hygrometricum]